MNRSYFLAFPSRSGMCVYARFGTALCFQQYAGAELAALGLSRQKDLPVSVIYSESGSVGAVEFYLRDPVFVSNSCTLCAVVTGDEIVS
ncbi:hypothetical protein UFOVP75_23 [uncultured Caudovirales phage]|uniref:Uncharacterized protein n=1 Tax=uncultured Caudovirales phage TaxID=2100421 RepID=A0A6J5L3Y0_9CAUD|nr:hypothetical protein UFOVP75_23 [uncultured Caudovirales phage]